jgi:hypothetical protein
MVAIRWSTIRRPVPGWSPPSATPVIPSIVSIITTIKPAAIKIKSKRPAGPWGIVHIESPGIRPRIIIMPVPGPVIIPGTINNGRSINIGIQVTRCIPGIDIIWCIIIDINILHIIHRIRWWNQVNIIRTVITGYPGSAGRI